MKKYLFLLLCCLYGAGTIAQTHPGFSRLYRYSGDTLRRADGVNALIFDSTEHCLYFTISGFAQNDLKESSVFYKTDLNGNVLKEVLDTFSNGSVYYHALAESNDHQYLYWGGACFEHMDSTQTQWKLIKTDKNLNKIWEKYYLTNATEGYTLSIKMLPDSENIMLLCRKNTPENNNGNPQLPPRIILRKMDSAGNLLSEYTPGPAYYNDGQDMELTDDGGYLVNGRTFSWGQNNGAGFVLKADQGGNEVWHQLYAQDAYSTWLNDLVKTRDGNHFFNAGQIAIDADYKGIGFVNKIDAQGNEIWHKEISKVGNADGFFGITNTISGGCIASGAVYFPEKNAARGWIVRLDKDGNALWDRLYTLPHPELLDDYLYRIIDLPDGSFVAAGSSWGQNENGLWTQDAWLLRVDSNGCLNPECSGLTVKDPAWQTEEIKLYPNPSSGTVTLERASLFPALTTVTLLDNLGRAIRSLPSPAGQSKMKYDLRNISPNVYYLRIEVKGEVMQKKITIAF